MKKLVIGFVLVMLVLVSGLVAAQSFSSIKRTFIIAESAVSEEVVFLSPEEVAAMQGADIWDVLVFVVGVIAIVVVLYLIIKKWLKKKPRVRKRRVVRRRRRHKK